MDNHCWTQNEKQCRLKLPREKHSALSNSLRELAKNAGRAGASTNTLLREAYGLMGIETHTIDGWAKRGGKIRKGQKAYHFWGQPTQINGHTFCPVVYMFAREQVYIPTF